MAPQTTFLENRFAFFYTRRDRSQKGEDAQSYANAVQKIGSFDSVEGFFGIYDHLVKPHSLTSDQAVTDYHLFREGVTPTWEDPKNKHGGKWIVRLRKVEGLASLYFEELIMAFVGETFGDVGCQVCGVVVSVRAQEDILSVWTADARDEDAVAKIRDAIKAHLDLPTFVTLEYKRHQHHGGRGGGGGGGGRSTEIKACHEAGDNNTNNNVVVRGRIIPSAPSMILGESILIAVSVSASAEPHKLGTRGVGQRTG